jgi:hypothetical protein
MLNAERKTRLQAVQQRDKSTEALPDLDWLRDEIRRLHEVTEKIGRQIHSLEVEIQAPQRIAILEEAAVPKR